MKRRIISDTVECFGFRLFCTIYALGLIPGVLVVFFFRWFFSIKIRKGGDDK